MIMFILSKCVNQKNRPEFDSLSTFDDRSSFTKYFTGNIKLFISETKNHITKTHYILQMVCIQIKFKTKCNYN